MLSRICWSAVVNPSLWLEREGEAPLGNLHSPEMLGHLLLVRREAALHLQGPNGCIWDSLLACCSYIETLQRGSGSLPFL